MKKWRIVILVLAIYLLGFSLTYRNVYRRTYASDKVEFYNCDKYWNIWAERDGFQAAFVWPVYWPFHAFMTLITPIETK